MPPHFASLINAVTLIACSLWAFVAIAAASFTALIPAAFGVALLACYKGLKAESKLVSHIAVGVMFVLLIALYMPASSALRGGEAGPILRSVLMVGTTLVALFSFGKSFRDARRARAAE